MNHMEHTTLVAKINLNSMLRSSLCDCSDAYILVKGTITVPNTGTAAAANNRNKKVTLCFIY